MQQRLLSHANRCVQQYHTAEKCNEIEDQDIDDAFHYLSNLYVDQSKLTKTKKMYQRTLNEYEKAEILKHTSTLNIVNKLSHL